MKVRNFTILCSLAVLALASCKKPGNEPLPSDPELTLISEQTVTVPSQGGSVTLVYSLENPVQGSAVVASVPEDVDWCSDFTSPTDSTVVFTVAENTGEARETQVTLTYSYGESLSKTLEVLLQQSAAEADNPDNPDNPDDPEEPAPVLVLTSSTQVTIPHTGDQVVVTYRVDNPAENGQIEASLEGAAWCSTPDVSVDGQVTFTAEANSGLPRSTRLVITYRYSGGYPQSVYVSVTQEERPFDYNLSAKHAFGDYHGSDMNEQESSGMLYRTTLSSSPLVNGLPVAGETYYVLSIYSSEPQNMNAIAPSAGTYQVSDVVTATGIDGPRSQILVAGTDEGVFTTSRTFTEGTLTIEYSAGIYTYDARLTDSEGQTHHLTYEGPVVMDDKRALDPLGDVYSTLSADVNISWERLATPYIYYYANKRIETVTEYEVTLQDGSYTDYRNVRLTFYLPVDNTMADGILAGEYPINSSCNPNTVRAGYLETGTSSYKYGGSWVENRQNVYPDTEAGPMAGGTVNVERTGDSYTITVNSYDDNATPFTITGTFTFSSPQYFDYTRYL